MWLQLQGQLPPLCWKFTSNSKTSIFKHGFNCSSTQDHSVNCFRLQWAATPQNFTKLELLPDLHRRPWQPSFGPGRLGLNSAIAIMPALTSLRRRWSRISCKFLPGRACWGWPQPSLDLWCGSRSMLACHIYARLWSHRWYGPTSYLQPWHFAKKRHHCP